MNKLDKRIYSRVRKYTWGLIFAWSATLAMFLAFYISYEKRAVLGAALVQAKSSYERDLLYRRWTAAHGGVYVPITPETQPNPYLDLPERDISTPSGKQLTLVNPAYMTRQVYDMARETHGIIGHITSIRPIRKQNAPDTWEISALKAVGSGAEEFSSVEIIEGQEYLRLMKPLITEPSCLHCHTKQGYKVGDVRGGISVAVPLAPLWSVIHDHMLIVFASLIFTWLIGLGGIYYISLRIRRYEEERFETSNQLQVSLRDKIILLRETYHRTQTNLKVVDSLLSIQRKKITDTIADRVLKDTQNRIRSMALVHQKLYKDDNLPQIDLQGYVEELVKNLLNSYNVSQNRISLKCEARKLQLSVDSAVACGIIISEIVTNSIQYAFPDTAQGVISLSATCEGHGEIILKINDNGVGVPNGLDLSNPETLGLQLIMHLVENHLHGNAKVSTENGVTWVIAFKDPACMM